MTHGVLNLRPGAFPDITAKIDDIDGICHVDFTLVHVIEHLLGAFGPDLIISGMSEQSDADNDVAFKGKTLLRLKELLLEAGAAAKCNYRVFANHNRYSVLYVSQQKVRGLLLCMKWRLCEMFYGEGQPMAPFVDFQQNGLDRVANRQGFHHCFLLYIGPSKLVVVDESFDTLSHGYEEPEIGLVGDDRLDHIARLKGESVPWILRGFPHARSNLLLMHVNGLYLHTYRVSYAVVFFRIRTFLSPGTPSMVQKTP